MAIAEPGFLAAGSRTFVDWGEPFIWFSSNGCNWELGLDPQGQPVGVVSTLTEIDGVAYGAGGLIGENGPGSGPASVWRSADGMTWTRVDLDGKGAGGALAYGPVRLGSSLLAVGSASSPRVGRVWSSPDGMAWTVLPDHPALHSSYVADVAVIGGLLVAVGAVWDDEASQGMPAIWTSPDGVAWTQAYLGSCCDTLIDVAATPGGAMAVSGNVVYTSEDGGYWRRAGTVAGFHGTFTALVETELLGLVAIGNDRDGRPIIVTPPSP